MIDLRTHMQTRRTVPSANLAAPGPDDAALQNILTYAARTPDHGKLVPYRFVVVRGDQRNRLSEISVERHQQIAAQTDRPLSDAEIDKTRNIFLFAPVIVGLINRSKEHAKIPIWEQTLAVGAVGMNLIHGSYAEGFTAQWLTGWVSTDPVIMKTLGVRSEETVAGFFHIGTPIIAPVERSRPDIGEITDYWGEN